MTKFVFVTGGVLSGVGKGVTAASIATLLQARGYSVNIQKCDPYFNVDAGTLNPAEHGEVFVTKDGAETDLDLGHYERFLNVELTQTSSTMSGRILRQVIDDEREGKYLGKTVQIIPHVTNAMQEAILAASEGFDVHIVEVGGTVGDYESTAFIEAIRQLKARLGAGNAISVHVVYLPFISASQEVKSKPAQNAVRDLREVGINPDILVARADSDISDHLIGKLSLTTGVPANAIVPMPTVETIYRVPLIVEQLGIGSLVCKQLGLKDKTPDLKAWKKLVDRITDKTLPVVKIGIVAKYLDHQDTYASVVEAIKSASWSQNKKSEIIWIDAEKLTKENCRDFIDKVDAIVVPGGFGERGIEGKINAAICCLQNNKPYLGLCLGMQVAAIGAARISGLTDANSVEFDPNTKHPVIDIMESQKMIAMKGGTMRLGNYGCKIENGSRTAKAYGIANITERHRHRYEFNSVYEKDLNKGGLKIVGKNPQTGLAEIVEAEDHPYFVATQYHPEFKSTPLFPHPLFVELIKATK